LVQRPGKKRCKLLWRVKPHDSSGVDPRRRDLIFANGLDPKSAQPGHHRRPTLGKRSRNELKSSGLIEGAERLALVSDQRNCGMDGRITVETLVKEKDNSRVKPW
jgi:hypothetical protein